MRSSLFVFSSLLIVTACTDGASPPVTPSNDVSSADAGMVPTDGALSIDAITEPDAASPLDIPTAQDFGRCGEAVHTCVCACRTPDLQCISTCARDAMDCQSCIEAAIPPCCPTEATAFQRCVTAARTTSDAGPPCTTNECVAMRCARELQALNSCVLRSIAMGTGGTTCQDAITACRGTARCVGTTDAGVRDAGTATDRPPVTDRGTVCNLTCSWSDGLRAGLSCGVGALQCMYRYNSLGQRTSASCRYADGHSFTCGINYNSLGRASGTCSGEGDTCSFRQ